MANKKVKRCPPKHKYTPNEIVKDLEGYSRIDRINDLEEWDRIKYLRKDTLEYRKGGWIVKVDKKKNYIVLEGFFRDWKTCRNMRFSINFDQVIIFRKDELLEEEIKEREKRKR